MLKVLAAAVLACAALPVAAGAAEVSGDWLGQLALPGNTAHLAIHLSRAADGAYSGTFDNLDSSTRNVPLSDLQATDERLSFSIPALPARFEGRWVEDRQAWAGVWTRPTGATAPLELSRGEVPKRPVVTGLDGDWGGAMTLGQGLELRLIFHIRTDASGTWGTADSPDQGGYGLALSSIARDGKRVKLGIASIAATFEGVLDDQAHTLSGALSQRGVLSPLVMRFTASDAPPPRPLPVAQGAPANVASDAEVLAVLKRRIDLERRGVGMVVGVIEPTGRRVISYGVDDPSDRRPVDGDTLFEIGSVTKVFTSLILADMVSKGEVALDDPVAKYLPPDVRLPSRNGRQITLVDLATHTAGLPSTPKEFDPKDPLNPYADFAETRLYAFLDGFQLDRDIGSRWEYSNIGVGLLGLALSRRAGTDYPSLVKARVLDPLRLPSTSIKLSPALKAKLAAGHDWQLSPTENWDLGAIPGAGALRSSANDLLSMLAAEMAYAPTALKPAMDFMLTTRRPSGVPNTAQALGWQVITAPSGEIITHSGGTGGYRSFVGYDPKRRTGIVVLSNAASAPGVDDIGIGLLTGRPISPLRPLPALPAAITVDPQAAAKYAGRYQLSPQLVIDLTADGSRLYARITGQPRYEVFMASPTRIFWKVTDTQADFDIGPDGAVVAMVTHQGGRDIRAPRTRE